MFLTKQSEIRAGCPVVGPVLTAQHHRAWLAFAIHPQHWQVCHWCPVLFTNENRFNQITCNRPVKVWRCRGESYSVCNIIQHVRFGVGSVMGWGGTSLGGHTDLYRLDNDTLTAIRYQGEIHGPDHVRTYAGAVEPGSSWCTIMPDIMWLEYAGSSWRIKELI